MDFGSGLGASGVGVMGWRREQARAWYVQNRPAIPTPLRVYYVDAQNGDDDTGDGSSGLPWQTITKINATRQPGDRFYLKGTFPDGEFIGHFGGTPGTAANPFQYFVWPGETATFLGGSVNGWSPIMAISHYLIFNGLTLRPSAQATAGAQADNSTPSNIQLLNIDSYGAFGIKNATNVWIEGCTLRAAPEVEYTTNTGDLIFLGGCTDCVVYDNDLGKFGHMGIDLGITADALENHTCRVGFNRVSNPWAGGIITTGGTTDCVIEGNDCWGNGVDPTDAQSKMGIAVYGTRNIVRYNRSWSNGGGGIQLLATHAGGFGQDCIDNRVYHNTCWDNQSLGLSMAVGGINALGEGNHFDAEMTGNVVENNLLWDNEQAGLGQPGTSDDEFGGWVDGSQYDLDINLYNASPTALDSWTVGGTTYTLNGNIVRHNLWGRPSEDPTTGTLLIFVLSAPVGYGGNSGYTLSGAESLLGSAFENNTHNVDPEFVSTDEADVGSTFLAIPSGSPAVDAGRVGVDGRGHQGSAPDCGAFEVPA